MNGRDKQMKFEGIAFITKIEYDGSYPNACRGNLVVVVNEKRWEFPRYCLSSGGSVWFDANWMEHIESGPWSVSEWPKNFPKEYRNAVVEAINEEIPCGCCGGCV